MGKTEVHWFDRIAAMGDNFVHPEVVHRWVNDENGYEYADVASPIGRPEPPPGLGWTMDGKRWTATGMHFETATWRRPARGEGGK
jgi:hypothetical protein